VLICIIHIFMSMRIIGFDPASTRNLGWSLVEISGENFSCSAGTFVIPTVDVKWKAYWPMLMVVDEFIAQEDPNVVIVEQTSAFSGGFVTGQVSHCLGVIFAACGKNGVDVGSVYPTHVKKVITDKGRATKSEMKKHTQDWLKSLGVEDVKFDSPHAYDAVANILCWLCDKSMIKKKHE